MCDLCLEFPCGEGCPNRPEDPEIAVCDFCGEPILPGDELLRFGRTVFCAACADGMSAREALTELGAEEARAERMRPEERRDWDDWPEGWDGGEDG